MKSKYNLTEDEREELKEALERVSLKNPAHFVSLGFGSGLIPKAPGTFGSIVALPIFLLMAYLNASDYWVVIITLAVIGGLCCEYTAMRMRIDDHPAIVFDEVVGMLVALSPFPFLSVSPFELHWVAVGFVLFRAFDILKPWPISYVDKKLKGGAGIILDDLLAGIFAAFILWVFMSNFSGY